MYFPLKYNFYIRMFVLRLCSSIIVVFVSNKILLVGVTGSKF